MRDAKHLEPYQYKIRLAKDEIPRILNEIREMKKSGRTTNFIIGMIMVNEDIGSTFAHQLYKSAFS